MKMEGDAGEMQPEAQEAGRGKEGTPPTPPGALRGTAALLDFGFQSPKLSESKLLSFQV